MKYELSKKEFKTIHNTAMKMMEMMCDIAKLSIEQSHIINLKRLELEERRVELEEKKSSIVMAQHDGDLHYPETDIEPEVQPALIFEREEVKKETEVVESFTVFPEENLTDHQSKGKMYLAELLNFWLQGFRDENAEQPNRTEYLEELARDGHRSGAIVSYSMAMAGLTKAVWNTLYEMVHVHGAEWHQYLTFESVRYIAGHICQVSSIHLAPLADEFEYPNPFLYMEE